MKNTRLNGSFIVLLSALTIIVIGCPPPHLQLDFIVGKKTKKTAHFQLEERGIDLSVSALSYENLNPVYNNYRLFLDIEVKYPSEGEAYSLHPREIKVLLGGRLLAKQEQFVDPRYLTSESGYYHVDLAYELVPFLEKGQVKHDVDSTVLIILNGFLKHDGTPVPFDTIHAIEPKLRRKYIDRNR